MGDLERGPSKVRRASQPGRGGRAPEVGLAPGKPEGVASRVQAELHGSLGNTVVCQALWSGDHGALGAMVSGGMAAAAGGLDVGTTPGAAANTTVLRVWRRDRGSDGVGAVLSSLDLAGGSPLSAEERDRFEESFEHDFSHVRIHADTQSRLAADALDARAFALGSHIFFGRDGWSPGSPATERLLAHELTHVVQHDEGRLPGAGEARVSSPSDPAEREAYGTGRWTCSRSCPPRCTR